MSHLRMSRPLNCPVLSLCVLMVPFADCAKSPPPYTFHNGSIASQQSGKTYTSVMWFTGARARRTVLELREGESHEGSKEAGVFLDSALLRLVLMPSRPAKYTSCLMAIYAMIAKLFSQLYSSCAGNVTGKTFRVGSQRNNSSVACPCLDL